MGTESVVTAPVRQPTSAARKPGFVGGGGGFYQALDGTSVSPPTPPIVSTPLTGEQFSALPLADITGPDQNQPPVAAEKIEGPPLMSRARQALLSSIEKDGKMYLPITDLNLDENQDVREEIERSAQAKARSEVGGKPDGKDQTVYDAKLAKAFDEKKATQIQARKDYNDKYAAFIRDDLKRMDATGLISTDADGQPIDPPTNVNPQIIEALSPLDTTLAKEFDGARRVVDDRGIQLNQVDFIKGHADAAQKADEHLSRDQAEKDARAEFENQAIIPKPEKDAPPEVTKPEAQKIPTTAEQRLAMQKEAAGHAMKFLEKMMEDPKLGHKAKILWANFLLSMEAIPSDGGATNVYLADALYSFRQLVNSDSKYKATFRSFGAEKLLNDSIDNLLNPEIYAVERRLDKKGIYRGSEGYDDKFKAEGEAYALEIGNAADTIMQANHVTLKPGSKEYEAKKNEYISTIRAERNQAIIDEFMNPALERAQNMVKNIGGLPWHEEFDALFQLGNYSEAMTLIYAALRQNDPKAIKAFLEEADVIKKNPNLKKILEGTEGEKYLQLFRTAAFGTPDKLKEMEQRLGEYLKTVLHYDEKGLRAIIKNFGGTVMGMSLMMLLQSIGGILSEGVEVTQGAPQGQ